MPAGADTGNTMRTLETLALIREEFGVNTTLRRVQPVLRHAATGTR